MLANVANGSDYHIPLISADKVKKCYYFEAEG